jgi:hypothetical protein
MIYVRFERGEHMLVLTFADSSKKIIAVLGDAPRTWITEDFELAATRLLSAGWEETNRGKVEV